MSSITLFVNVNNKHAYKQKHAATHSPHFAKNDESDTSITDDENDDEISEESETDTCHSKIVELAPFIYNEEKY